MFIVPFVVAGLCFLGMCLIPVTKVPERFVPKTTKSKFALGIVMTAGAIVAVFGGWLAILGVTLIGGAATLQYTGLYRSITSADK